MEDQNVPLDRRPSEQTCLRVVEAPVDERPQRAEHRRTIPDALVPKVVECPRIDGYLVDESDAEDDNHGVIVESKP